MRISRREFVTSITASGIALSMSRLAIAEEPSFAERETLPGRQRWNPAAGGRGRIDALPKVTGAKLYASDFRAADLPGWPQNTSHAMLIRTADATHVLMGIDVSLLAGALKPSVVVTADDLARIGARRRRSSSTSPFNAATVRPASATRARFCSNVWQRKQIARADLGKTIAEALDGHLCRCTGYIKYHEAVRAVILADPSRYLS
jgi:hypothetical protein